MDLHLQEKPTEILCEHNASNYLKSYIVASQNKTNWGFF